MGRVTEHVLWNDGLDWIADKQPNARLITRVGSGNKTYCRHARGGCEFTLTYGVKMIASKFHYDTASRWATFAELTTRGYYNSEITPLNLLSHTVCHEFTHIIQAIKGWRYDGSVHNKEFYYLLDKLHSNEMADKVRDHLLHVCQKRSIDVTKMQGQVAQKASVIVFRKDLPVEFDSRDGQTIKCIVKKVNPKTITVAPEEPGSHRGWRVPHSMLRLRS